MLLPKPDKNTTKKNDELIFLTIIDAGNLNKILSYQIKLQILKL